MEISINSLDYLNCKLISPICIACGDLKFNILFLFIYFRHIRNGNLTRNLMSKEDDLSESESVKLLMKHAEVLSVFEKAPFNSR